MTTKLTRYRNTTGTEMDKTNGRNVDTQGEKDQTTEQHKT